MFGDGGTAAPDGRIEWTETELASLDGERRAA
jgi:hypothetical protein